MLSEERLLEIEEEERARAKIRRRIGSDRPPANRGIAFLLSAFFPGVGQMYKGDVGAGFFWLLLVGAGYVALIVPGLCLHLLCVVDAAVSRPNVDLSWKRIGIGVSVGIGVGFLTLMNYSMYDDDLGLFAHVVLTLIMGGVLLSPFIVFGRWRNAPVPRGLNISDSRSDGKP